MVLSAETIPPSLVLHPLSCQPIAVESGTSLSSLNCRSSSNLRACAATAVTRTPPVPHAGVQEIWEGNYKRLDALLAELNQGQKNERKK